MIKLLVVDDQPDMRDILRDFFKEKGYEVSVAEDGEKALQKAREISPHLVFLDIGLPGISGLEVLPQIKEIDPAIKVIMITAFDDPKKIAEARAKGASDYITKPVSLDYLQTTVLNKVYAQLFEDLRKEHQDLLKAYEEIIYALAKALEEKDAYTRGHSERVTGYAVEIAQELKLTPPQIETLSQAGHLHDIGKIGIKDGILNKPAKLTEEEWEQVKKHPVTGAEILGNLSNLREHALIARYHHERWNGGGYPSGLSKTDIPLLARILAIADAYDAMTSERPYRKPMEPQEAVKELIAGKGTQFDPKIVDAFAEALKKKGVI